MGPQVLALATLRGGHIVALASLFGTLVSLVLVAPAGLREAGPAPAAIARRRLLQLAHWSARLAFLLGVLWLLLETATMAGVTSLGATFRALGTVLAHTRFGQLILIRLGLLGLAMVVPAAWERAPQALLGWREGSNPARIRVSTPLSNFDPLRGPSPQEARESRWAGLKLALLLAAAALGMQGFFGHAGATGGSTGVMLLISESLHLLAAGAWLGGLLPLFLLVRTLPPPAAAEACEHFSPIGLAAVLAIACTAVVQAWVLIGGWGGLFGTSYGQIALLKLGLFCLLLLLAGTNRFILTARLRDQPQTAAVRAMELSLGVETTLGVAVIVVAAFLASGMPAVHAIPVWPFVRRPSLEPLATAQAWVRAFYAVLPSLAGIALAVAAVSARQLLWPALAVLVVCLAASGWWLEPLVTVPAYPTSYQTSPTAFAATSIMRGEALFLADCAVCGEAQAQSGGEPKSGAPQLPAELTTARAWTHTQGDLYWFIAHGDAASHGMPALRGFTTRLSSGQIWSLIDFLRAESAGYSMATTGRWAQPTPLPHTDAVCADGSAINDDDLRGRVVHIIAAAHSVMPPPAPPGIDVATLVLARSAAVKPLGTACVATTPAAWGAFALVLGVAPDALAGTQVLADGHLWLRRRRPPGAPDDWTDPAELNAAIRAIAAHPMPGEAGEDHGHHH